MTGSEPGDEGSAERLQAVFEHAFDAIVIADDDGRYLEANAAACELFGLDRSDLLGRRVEEFAAPEYDYDAEWRRFEGDSRMRGTFPLRRDDGEVRLVEYAATRDIRSGEHLSIMRDVTEQIARKEELEAQLERLDQFASMVSHDLRNPLNVAMARIELYRETGEREHVEAAIRALEAIEQITGELLTLVRRADDDTERSEVAVGALAREVWEEVDTREATLEVVGDLTLVASRGQLHLLLSNLFRNAVGHGGYDTTIRVGTLDGDGTGAEGFFVEDTGEGIPEADREAVLESGYTTGYGGSGVGLTIIQQIAEAHDWSVEVGESAEGGARFTFRAASG